MALATGLTTAIDGLRVGGGDVCAGSISVGGTALRVFFWCVVVAGYFLGGYSAKASCGQMKNDALRTGSHEIRSVHTYYVQTI